MVASFPVTVLISAIFGFLSGLGVGGGSLLMLWLTAVADMEYPEARCINLLFFIPSAAIACLFRWRQGSLRWRILLPGIAAGCTSAAVFSLVSRIVDGTLMKRLFGILLIAAGLSELFRRKS